MEYKVLTVDAMIEILVNLSKEGYGSTPMGIETLGDITCCLSREDVHYDESYDAVMISTTNI